MIRHIVAHDSKRGIARAGEEPWKLPSERNYFSTITKQFGGNLLMGRKTYEAIGRPLPERQMFVLSSTMSSLEGVKIVPDLDTFLRTFNEDIWVIGGQDVFAATIDQASELFITQIEGDFNCDRYYPSYEQFKLRDKSPQITESDLSFHYSVYIRISS